MIKKYKEESLVVFNKQVLSRFSNLKLKQNIKVKREIYKYFKLKINQYRILNIIPLKDIKFYKIKY